MAGIPYIRNEDSDILDVAMETEYDEGVVDMDISDGSGNDTWDGSGEGGDEGECNTELLLKYVNSETYYGRKKVSRILVTMFRDAVNTGTKLDVNDVMQSIQPAVLDADTRIRADWVERLQHIAMICQEAPHLFGNGLNEHFLGIMLKYLSDEDNQVRLASHAALLALIKQGLLDNETVRLKVWPVIDSLLTMDGDFFSSGISLMSKMAPLIGEEMTQKLFLDRYISLCSKEEFCIRKACARHFGELCMAVEKENVFLRLFPIFLDLCADDNWDVRKACVDAMMAVSCCLTLKCRRLLLADLLATFLNDESKWVRMSAFQILGPFISMFANQFKEVTNNQDGEIVYTTKAREYFIRSLRLSSDYKNIPPLPACVRYSYEGVFPTKCAIRVETVPVEGEEFDESDKSDASDASDASDLSDASDASDDSSKSEEVNELDKSDDLEKNALLQVLKNEATSSFQLDDRLRRKCEKFKRDLKEIDKYNPFLYYYIPPDLPLDDELVKAAKKTAPESKSNEKLANSRTDIGSSSSDHFIAKEDQPKFKGEDIVPQHLIDSFLWMAEELQYAHLGKDIPFYCAFHFPAVVLTVGRKNWPYLRGAYETLASDPHWKVRATIASSIHELALILGNKITVKNLLPIYDGFIDDSEEVSIRALKHFAALLKLLMPKQRKKYIEKLEDFLQTGHDWTINWRFREVLANQLVEIVSFTPLSEVDRHIVPLTLDLIYHKIAAVRQAGLNVVTHILAQFIKDRNLGVNFFRKIRFHLVENSMKWFRRQMYAKLCAQLIENNAISRDIFAQEMLPPLLKLCSDSVPNVRLAVARTLSRHVITMGPEWLTPEEAEEVEKHLKQMRLDPDRDVRIPAGGDENIPPVIIAQDQLQNSLSS